MQMKSYLNLNLEAHTDLLWSGEMVSQREAGRQNWGYGGGGSGVPGHIVTAGAGGVPECRPGVLVSWLLGRSGQEGGGMPATRAAQSSKGSAKAEDALLPGEGAQETDPQPN